jgi:hypothetical protein
VQAARRVPPAAAASCLFPLCLCFSLAASRRLQGEQLVLGGGWQQCCSVHTTRADEAMAAASGYGSLGTDRFLMVLPIKKLKSKELFT